MAAPAHPPLVEPLAPARYLVRFTASAELREKLERVEARRFGRARAPRSHLSGTDTTPSSRHIPAAVRHNALVAEQDCGEDVMARFRAAASRAAVPVDAYGARIVVRPRRLSSG